VAERRGRQRLGATVFASWLATLDIFIVTGEQSLI